MNKNLANKLKPLRLQLGAWWISGWALCVISLGTTAVYLKMDLERQGLDAQLSLYATATYGLSWFDAKGDFHGETLERDPELLNAPYDIWIIQPGSPEVIYWQPDEPKFVIDKMAELAQQAMEMDPSFHIAVQSIPGTTYRLQISHVFQDTAADLPWATILVIGDASGIGIWKDPFVFRLIGFCLLLLGGGIVLGLFLTHRNVAPVAHALQERERFLAAAAHELRTPLTQVKSIVDSADGTGTALGRIDELVDQTAQVVDDLLLYTRLDSGDTSLNREPVRLDLLFESLQPEELALQIEGGSVLAKVDVGLFTVVIRNLFKNALQHGAAGDGGCILQLSADEILFTDSGPGFSDELMQQMESKSTFLSSDLGVGLGMTIMRQIIEMHGGELLLTNHESGGAKIILRSFSTELS